MGVFEMVVLIVAISVGAGVYQNYLKLKVNRRDDGEADLKIAQMQSEVDRLKERVRVLEKITTDSDRQLHDEITRLA
jgi:hypothetical protein